MPEVTCVYCGQKIQYRFHHYGSGWTHVRDDDPQFEDDFCKTGFTVASLTKEPD